MKTFLSDDKQLTRKDSLNLFGAMVIALIASILVLVTTLNFFISLVVFFLCFSAAIFSRSFSRGFILVFLILLTFPAYKIASGKIISFDLILILLVIVGIIKISGEKIRFKINIIPFSIRILFLIIFGLIVSGIIFKIKFNENFWLTASLELLTFLFVVFISFFFQTRKRIELVIKTIIFSAACHSFFGLIAFFSNWQMFSGLSWTKKAIFFPLSKKVENQAIGLFGTDLFLRLGSSSSPLAEFLLISIPLTMGLILNLKMKPQKKLISFLEISSSNSNNFFNNPKLNINISSEKKERFLFFKSFLARKKTLKDFLKNNSQTKKLFLAISKRGISLISKIKNQFYLNQGSFRFWIFLKQVKQEGKEFFSKKIIFLLFLLVLQTAGLIVTFSYFHFIFLLAGILIMTILLRKRRLSFVLASLILVLFFLPAMLRNQPEISFYFSKSFQEISCLKNYWFLGAGWRISKEIENIGKISNSYLYFWNTFGFFGLLAITTILIDFFNQIRKTYLISDGKERNLVVAILGAFIGFVWSGFFSNALLFGPAALVFWSMYAMTLNLRKKQVIFGITETRLEN